MSLKALSFECLASPVTVHTLTKKRALSLTFECATKVFINLNCVHVFFPLRQWESAQDLSHRSCGLRLLIAPTNCLVLCDFFFSSSSPTKHFPVVAEKALAPRWGA